ncbi:unnamed protein product [Coccothraustes coccothraustes]
MRRRRGPLAKVKLKMPVAVRSPPAEAEQGPGGGPFRGYISTSPVSPLPALSPGTCGAEARSEGLGRCSVLRGGAGGAECRSSGPWGRGQSQDEQIKRSAEPSPDKAAVVKALGGR